MKNLYTKAEIKQIDKLLEEELSIPARILMENVANNAASYIIKYFNENNLNIRKIAIFCGSGNNGGDGLALGRHLSELFDVTIFQFGNIEKMSTETRKNYEIIKNIPIIQLNSVTSLDDINQLTLDFDCIIDSLIGIGGSDKLRENIIPLLKKINNAKAVKIAIDMPTGLDADTSKAHTDTFRADLTINITGYKFAAINKKCQPYYGETVTVPLNTSSVIENKICRQFVLEPSDLDILHQRKYNSSKFDYGKVLIIAGSIDMCGAAALAANASIKSGAGITTLLTPKIHPAILPEVIAETLSSTHSGTIHPSNYLYIMDKIQSADTILLGPGIGTDQETLNMLRQIIFNTTKPMVIDADALRCININDKLRPNIVLTPHSGEFSRLLNIPRKEIEENPIEFTKNVAKQLNCTILLKTIPNIITEGNLFYWNIYGNPGMSTAGSGDVLSGIIASMLFRIKADTLKAAAISSLIHALAGDAYAEDYNQNSLTASNIIEYLKYVI